MRKFYFTRFETLWSRSLKTTLAGITLFRSETQSPSKKVMIVQKSEAFILTSTNPQYDSRLFIDLPVQYMKTTSSEHGENMSGCCAHKLLFIFVLTFRTIDVHNKFFACSFHDLNW